MRAARVRIGARCAVGSPHERSQHYSATQPYAIHPDTEPGRAVPAPWPTG